MYQLSSLFLLAAAVKGAAVPTPANNAQDDHTPHEGSLYPAVHWDQKLDDIRSLVPGKANRLYYADMPGKQTPLRSHRYASLDTEFDHPTVVSEHSEFIKNIQCNQEGNRIQVELAGDSAFDTAKENWGDKFVLSTYSPSCDYKGTKRSFYLAKTVSAKKSENGGTIFLKGEQMTSREALPKVNLEWGDFKAPTTDVSQRSLLGNNTKTFHGGFDFNLAPPSDKLEQTRFGSSFPLGGMDIFEEDFKAYCVECGVSGHVEASGKAVWSITSGLEDASITAKITDVAGAFNLGVIGYEFVYKNFPVEIASVSPTAILDLEEIINVGPMVTLNAVTTLTLHHNGTLYAGLNATFPELGGTLDFINPNSSHADTSNLQVDPTFQASGSLGASISFGPAVEVGFGINIPPIQFQKTIGIVDNPAIVFDVTYDETGCEGGIDASIQFKDTLALDIFGVGRPLKTWPLGPKIYNNCLQGPGIGPGSGPGGAGNGTNTTSASVTGAEALKPVSLQV